MSQVIRISESIYERLESMAKGFDTPGNVIERLLEFYEKNPNFTISLNQLKYAFKFPFSSALYDIQRQCIQPNLEAPVIGLSSAEKTMEEAVKEANKFLERYK